VQALLLLVLHKILNTDEKVFQLVDEQWLEAVGRITGQKPHWRQLQRIKDRFLTRKKGARITRATKWELLRETRKGRIGLPSRYRLSGIATVIQQGDAGLLGDVLWRLAAYQPDEQEQAHEAFSLARGDTLKDQGGPETSGAIRGPGGANGTPWPPT
jgi:hypothetical protein